jgi:hypothetical protein
MSFMWTLLIIFSCSDKVCGEGRQEEVTRCRFTVSIFWRLVFLLCFLLRLGNHMCTLCYSYVLCIHNNEVGGGWIRQDTLAICSIIPDIVRVENNKRLYNVPMFQATSFQELTVLTDMFHSLLISNPWPQVPTDGSLEYFHYEPEQRSGQSCIPAALGFFVPYEGMLGLYF